MKPLLLRPLCAALLLITTTPALADVLSPYRAVYEVTHGKMMLGDTTFSLTPDKATGTACHVLSGVAKPMGLAALFSGPMTEESHFCLEDGQLRSKRYRIQREGGGKNENYSLSFDWGNRMVTTEGQEPRELPAGGIDRSVMEIALRRELARAKGGPLPAEPFVFLRVEDDEIKPFTLQVTGRETLKTPLGRFDTVRVERINDPKRKFRLWLAPSLDYLPVRIENQKGNKPVMRMNLRELPVSPSQ